VYVRMITMCIFVCDSNDSTVKFTTLKLRRKFVSLLSEKCEFLCLISTKFLPQNLLRNKIKVKE
jgi:hypothetical protein